MKKFVGLAPLKKEYNLKKSLIQKRLKEFKKLKSKSQAEIFEELAFCLFTPGSKALNGEKAVKRLKRAALLFKGEKDAVSRQLRGLVRFHNNKASFLIGARKLFINNDEFSIRKKLKAESPFDVRSWLVTRIKGIGYKEASHFLRNIGFGSGLAILDRHILKNLKKHKVIESIPLAITGKTYIIIEEKMRRFSKRARIPMDALDLLFWSRQTGSIFK